MLPEHSHPPTCSTFIDFTPPRPSAQVRPPRLSKVGTNVSGSPRFLWPVTDSAKHCRTNPSDEKASRVRDPYMWVWGKKFIHSPTYKNQRKSASSFLQLKKCPAVKTKLKSGYANTWPAGAWPTSTTCAPSPTAEWLKRRRATTPAPS